MTHSFTCPHCGGEIEITQALGAQAADEIRTQITLQNSREVEVLKKQLEDQGKKVEDLREQEIKLRQEKRLLEEKEKDIKLQIERAIDAQKKKFETETLKEVEHNFHLKEMEKDKLIQDLKSSLEEAQRKATTVSQQLQGEVQELDMEALLRTTFPTDGIEPVGKGITGADIRQIVRTQRGTNCGTILWESKRTKAWSDSWVTKLKSDLLADKSHIGAIVSQIIPESVHGIGVIEGVWICTLPLVVPLATLLRKSLIDSARERAISQNRQERSTQLYNYVTSHEFVQQVESMIEIYEEMQQQLTKERIAFERYWKTRESQILRLTTGVGGIYGFMQGIAGSALPPIKSIELPHESE